MATRDPYAVLGISPESDDATIRARYLELVKQNPPELNPRRFSEIRAAYEQVRDLHTRLRQLLFEHGRRDDLDQLIEDLACRTSRPRPTLQQLIQASRQG